MPCWKRSKRTVRTKDIKLIIDKDLDRNKDIKNHLFFGSFDSATVSLTVIRYLIEYAAFHSE